MSASLFIVRQQLRHVLDTEDAAVAAAQQIEDPREYLKAMVLRRATLHNALRAIADMLDGVDREVQE